MRGVVRGMVHGAVHGVMHGVTHGVMHGVTHGVTHGVMHGVTHGVTHGVMHGVTHGVTHGVMHGARVVQARKAQQVELDRRHLDTTQLRSGRIRRLRDLCEQGGGGGGHLSITMNGGGDGGDGGEVGKSGPAGGVRYLCQVPDGAVKEEKVGGERGAARLPQPLSNGAPPDDAAHSASLAVAGSTTGAIAAADATAGPALHRPRQCYTCKARFVSLHHFYASLCPKCAALNFRMRHASQRCPHMALSPLGREASCLRPLCCPWRACWWRVGAVPLRRGGAVARCRGASATPCPAEPFWPVGYGGPHGAGGAAHRRTRQGGLHWMGTAWALHTHALHMYTCTHTHAHTAYTRARARAHAAHAHVHRQRTHRACAVRIQVGYETGLKLLRAGATLIATTRFPADAARRYADEADFCEWRGRLQLHAVDFRDVGALEGFCAFLCASLQRLDIVINNACQTIRRPAAYYTHLLRAEDRMEAAVAALEGGTAAAAAAGTGTPAVVRTPSEAAELLPLFAQQAQRARWREAGDGLEVTWVRGAGGEARGEARPARPTPAQLSQLRLGAEDDVTLTPADAAAAGGGGGGGGGGALLPAGALDVNGQQVDLRSSNSWVLKMSEVSTPELVEVFAINTLAPFLLNARLQPLLAASAKTAPPAAGSDAPRAAFVVNVSAMEGKFYRHKTPNHPHTNMAKAALNMMTRTSAPELAASHAIYMTAVDTGWINDENPREKATRTAEVHGFQTPLDEVDAAARVLHPVFEGLTTGKPQFGVFIKDFVETEW